MYSYGYIGHLLKFRTNKIIEVKGYDPLNTKINKEFLKKLKNKNHLTLVISKFTENKFIKFAQADNFSINIVKISKEKNFKILERLSMNNLKKDKNTTIAALIPCLNEEKTIALTIKNIKKFCSKIDIYVCDNGSTDQTSQIAKSLGAYVITGRKKRERLRDGSAFSTC